MDQNPSAESNPQMNPSQPGNGPVIRTMSKDIGTLEKEGAPASPIAELGNGTQPAAIPLGITPPMAAMPEPAPGPGGPIGVPPTPPPLEETPTIPSGGEEMVISEKALTEFAPPEPPKKDIKKMAIIGGIVLIVVIALGAAGWFLYPSLFSATPIVPPPVLTPFATLTPAPTPVPTEIPTPTPIVFFKTEPEKTAVIDMTPLTTKSELDAAIRTEVQQNESSGIVKLLDLRQDGKEVTFDQFTTVFGLNFPAELKTITAPSFKFFVNVNAEEGNHLGLILYVNDPMMAQQFVRNWEPNMSTDLLELFLGAETGTKTDFRDSTYRSVPKRFIPFSKPPFSVDYTVYQNLLVIGTSRNSFSNALDHLLGPAV